MSEEVLPSMSENQEEDKAKPDHDVFLPEEVEELLEDLPDPQKKAVRAVLLGFSYQQSLWRGPLPPPDVLKQYNDAFENGAERLFLEAQKQTDHRISMENRVIPEEQKQSSNGQIFAFIIAMSLLIVSGFLIYTGHDTAGTVLGSVDLVALVAIFITGRKTQRKEIDESQ